MSTQLTEPVEAWQQRAACIGLDPDVFHPSFVGRRQAQAYRTAKAICASCPVQAECLTYALTVEGAERLGRHGVWGGTTPEQRDRIAREQRASA